MNRLFQGQKGKRLAVVIMLLLQACLLAWPASVWWASRNNTLFGNGRWISGKNTGKFVFFSYEFLSRPLLHSRINLSDDMGFQEILYSRPEGPDRRLTRLQAEVYIARGSYLWIELRKEAMRLLGCRLSRLSDFPSGFYEFDENGEVTARLPYRKSPLGLGDEQQLVDLRLIEGEWRLSLNGEEIGAVPDPPFPYGHIGFKGSGNVHAPVRVKNILMTFEDPGSSGRTWVEEEKFSIRRHVRRVLKYGFLFAVVVLLLRRGRGLVLARLLAEGRRAQFLRVENRALLLLLALLAVIPVTASGLQLAGFILASEVMTFITLGLFRRKDAASSFDVPAAVTWSYGASVVLISATAAVLCGDQAGRIREVVPVRMVGVHPDAYLVHPEQTTSAEPFTIESPVRVGFGSPLFTEGLAYRDQLITADVVIPSNSTLDIAFQQQSLLTHGDPQGEAVPLQRRIVRLSTRDDVPIGLAMGDRSRLAPFRKINGTVRTGEENRVEIRTDDRGIRITLNGDETLAPDYEPLGFGETGFLVYGEPVLLQRVRVEPTAALAVREDLRPWLGALPFAMAAILLWLAVRRGGITFRSAAAAEWSALYPLSVYFLAALFLGPETLRFIGHDRLAWLDIALIATAIAHLGLILMMRQWLRFPVVLFNVAFLLLIGFCVLLVWDLLPAGHSLRLQWAKDTVAPGENIERDLGRQGPWYTNNRRIGSSTYVWKHRFGGEDCTIPKPEGVVRIFVTGGSQAWGSGAANSRETFVELLEKSLRAKGLPVEVFNAGVNGAGLGRVMEHYRELIRHFEPDILIADVGLNDSAALKPLASKDQRARGSRLLTETFRELARQCREDGVDLVLAPEAMAGELPLRPHAGLYAAMVEIAHQGGSPVVEVADTMREKEKDHFVWWDTAHYAPYGHHVFAALLHPVVEQAVRNRLETSASRSP